MIYSHGDGTYTVSSLDGELYQHVTRPDWPMQSEEGFLPCPLIEEWPQ